MNSLISVKFIACWLIKIMNIPRQNKVSFFLFEDETWLSYLFIIICSCRNEDGFRVIICLIIDTVYVRDALPLACITEQIREIKSVCIGGGGGDTSI